MTIILCGSRDTIPTDVLEDLIDQTRAGAGRLVIVDEGSGLAARYADHERDVLLDPAIGNWDFFADHLSEYELACAAEAILPRAGLPARVYHAGAIVLADLMREVAYDASAQLHNVSTRLRAFGYAELAATMRLDLDNAADTREGWSTLALLQENAGRFAMRAPACKPVFLRSWMLGDPRIILFVSAGAGVDDGACRSVAAMIARLEELGSSVGRPIRLVRYAEPGPRDLPLPVDGGKQWIA